VDLTGGQPQIGGVVGDDVTEPLDDPGQLDPGLARRIAARLG
jgi:hypothetical protein